MKKRIAAVWALAGLAALLIFLLYRTGADGDPSDRITLMFSAATAIFGIGAVVGFLTSLKNFKAELRLPYVLLSVGIILVPLPQLLLSAAIIFNLYASSFIQYMPHVSITIFAATAVCMYAGIHRFATIMSVRSIWARYRYTLPIAALAVGAVYGIICVLKGDYLTSWQIKLGIATFVEYAVFALMAAVLAWRIKSSLGASYNKAISWLIAAFLVTALSSTHEILLGLYLPPTWVAYATYGHWPYLVAAMLFAYTGQLFYGIDINSRKLARDASYIDAIVQVAGLASKVEEIDPLLDELRQVTSHLPQGAQQLSDSDRVTLIRLYYKLEQYLINKDPLRTFTQEEVRSHLTYDFRQLLQPAANNNS